MSTRPTPRLANQREAGAGLTRRVGGDAKGGRAGAVGVGALVLAVGGPVGGVHIPAAAPVPAGPVALKLLPGQVGAHAQGASGVVGDGALHIKGSALQGVVFGGLGRACGQQRQRGGQAGGGEEGVWVFHVGVMWVIWAIRARPL